MKTYLSSIPMLVYRLSRRNPDKVAVIDSDFKTYTYRALNNMADTVNAMFPTKGAARVGILTSSGINQIAAILSIVKNGGTYVPIDPALNGTAIRKAVANAAVDFVITDKANKGRLGDIPFVELPDEITYSESMGFAPISLGGKTVACAMPAPNGQFEELNCVAVRKHARSLCDEFGISSNDIVLQSAVASSPMFLAEVFATMMKGATLAILPEKNRAYAKAVADFAERAGVTVICGYRPMVDEIGLLKRMPSKLRMLLGVASDRLASALAGFNKTDAWRGWVAVRFGKAVRMA